MPTIEFQGDDAPAIEYIRKRGYASYSSLKNVRDKLVPEYKTTTYFTFGGELHSRSLEHHIIEELSTDEEIQLWNMYNKLWSHPVWRKLLAKAKVEQEFKQLLWGVMVLGYIDILNTTNVCDLKTTSCTTMKQFVASMDFLQAALYLAVTGFKDFYYIGISKKPPHEVFVFNVNQYPDRINAANRELKNLIAYLKLKL